jgi:hypothetical protein
MTNAVGAGWFDDPESPGVLRWWDGSAWTEHRAPKPSAVQQQVIVGGYRKGYKTSHGFHLIMSICTLGLWLPVWLIVGIYNAARS